MRLRQLEALVGFPTASLAGCHWQTVAVPSVARHGLTVTVPQAQAGLDWSESESTRMAGLGAHSAEILVVTVGVVASTRNRSILKKK